MEATTTGTMMGTERKRMMAPSIGCAGSGGGDEDETNGGGSCGGAGTRAGTGAALAFMSGIRFRRRTSSVGASSTAACLSSSSSSLEGDGSFHRGGGRVQRQLQQHDRTPRPDEPNLFNIPSDLRATYRPLPILLHVGIFIASGLLVQRRDLSLSLFRQLHQKISVSVLRRAFSFILRTLLVSTIARLAIQETLFPPSRVTTQHLAVRGELPSRLSRYQTVAPLTLRPAPAAIQSSCVEGGKDGSLMTTRSWVEKEEGEGLAAPIGVHSIQYTKQNGITVNEDHAKHEYDGIYLHHGFGASSLSWLPILPSLVEKFGGRSKEGGRPTVGVAHDAPGFGFTERPTADGDRGVEQYGAEKNVGIGLALLKETLLTKVSSRSSEQSWTHGEITDGGEKTAGEEDGAKLAIFGHSMGSKAALLMAIRCSQHVKLKLRPRLVVLVAPALVGVSLGAPKGPPPTQSSPHERYTKKKSTWIRKTATRILITWRKIFLYYPFCYGLRRLVGGKDFWRKGLAVAWGDTVRLSDSDVLRYQWPSIGKGWEMGLINFARSQFVSPSFPTSLDDYQLLREVSNLNDTTVVIMYGSKDKVLRIDGPVVERIRNDYPNIKLVRIQTGHNPFEEDVDGFLLELEKVLEG